MTVYSELEKDTDVDLAGVFASIWRNKFKLLILSILATVLAFFILQTISPRYRSEARILIRTSDPVLSSRPVQNNRDQSVLDERGIASKVQLLKSRSIADKVIQKLDLKSYEEFDSALNRGPLDRLLGVFGLAEDLSNVTAEDRVLEYYYKQLNVFQAERSRVIVVSFSSQDPGLAAAIPNMISDEYVALQKSIKRGAPMAQLEKLQTELTQLNAEVKADEAAMANFRNEKDLLQGNNNNTLATQELSELATELGRVRSQLSQAQANAASVSRALNSGALDSSARVLQSPLIQRLQERKVNLQTQLSDLSTSLLSGHPRIRRIQSQLSTLDNQISKEARKIESSLQQEVNVAREREGALLDRRQELKIEAGRVGKEQVELQEMQRELVAKQALLSQYTVRLKEAKSRQSRDFLPVDAYVFSNAQVPSKSYFPKKGPILAGVFFGTFVLGSMITLAGSMLGGAARSQDTVRETINYDAKTAAQKASADFKDAEPVSLQSQPEVSPQSQSEVSPVDAPPIAPNMNSLMAALDEPQVQGDSPPNGRLVGTVSAAASSLKMLGHGRIAVLTPDESIGSAAVVILSRQLAEKGNSVILVDLTTNGNSGRTMLGRAPSLGVKDLLSNSAAVVDAIHCDKGGTNVHVMPSGFTPESDASHGADRLLTILDALQRSYDFVVVDCGDTDINGLKHISDVETITVINAKNASDTTASMMSEMLMRSGFGDPLMIHATQNELSTLRSTVA